jgi:hypothetical protein
MLQPFTSHDMSVDGDAVGSFLERIKCEGPSSGNLFALEMVEQQRGSDLLTIIESVLTAPFTSVSDADSVIRFVQNIISAIKSTR